MSAPTGMVECPVCQTDVPAGEFCGLCGVPLAEHSGDGPRWLRARAFSAAPGQRLLTPAPTSSLFPHLTPRSRRVFLMGLGLLAAALAVATFLRMPAALVAVASLGLPLLFALYLRESAVFRDFPRSALALTTVLGVVLGVGWALLTGAAVARAYGVPLGAGIAGGRILRDGVGVPVGSMVLMLVPALVTRWSWRGDRAALDGYIIGALGALTFTAAATLTRLAPQFTTGMVNRVRPLEGLLVEAGVRGIAMPLTAAAVGGLIGTALWFTRPPAKAQDHPGFVRGTLVLIAVVVVAIYASLGLVDVARLPQLWQLALHLTLTGIALFALRVGLHLALLHEAHGGVHTDEPILCVECNHVVPDAPFCARCGVAMQACSRRWGRGRRARAPPPGGGGVAVAPWRGAPGARAGPGARTVPSGLPRTRRPGRSWWDCFRATQYTPAPTRRASPRRRRSAPWRWRSASRSWCSPAGWSGFRGSSPSPRPDMSARPIAVVPR